MLYAIHADIIIILKQLFLMEIIRIREPSLAFLMDKSTMKNAATVLLIIFSAMFLACGCSVLGFTNGTTVDAALYNLESTSFTTESIKGNVQIKEHRNAPWRDLKAGDVFNGYAFIRTGYKAGAELLMKDGEKKVECEIGSLICEVTIRDIIAKVLSNDGISKYNKAMWKKKERIDPNALVLVSRKSLNGEDDEDSLLAEVKTIPDMKSINIAGGAAGAAGGGAGPGGGGSGGGCGPGG